MIAYFVPLLYPCHIGGLEIYYYHLIKNIQPSQKAIVFTTCKKFSEQSEKWPISNKIFGIKRFHLGQISLFITSFFGLLKHRKDIEVIHVSCTSNSGFYGYFFPIIKKVLGIPYVIQFHGGGMFKWKKGDGNAPLFKHASEILAVSETIKEEYSKRVQRELQIVLPLVPYKKSNVDKVILKEKYGFKNDDKVILMVGSVKPIKGNLWVLDEFNRLGLEYIKNNKLKLLIVGNGIDIPILKNKIQKYKLGNFVKTIEHVPNEIINEVYEISDYYIIASDYEGTPKSLLEALYHGLPIIGTNVNGINSIIHHKRNGYLVEKRDNELVAAIIELQNNQQLRESVSEAAFKLYQSDYSYDKIINQLKGIYFKVKS
jgi:glycosyltransferase involved in cell wall biosynthesis